LYVLVIYTSMSILFLWVVTPCGLVCGYKRFGGLRIEAVCPSETLVSTYESTRRYKPEDQHRHPHRRESLRSHTHSRYSLHPAYSRLHGMKHEAHGDIQLLYGTVKPNVAVEWLALIFSNRKVPRSNLGLETGCRFIVVFLNLSRQITR
jgi:hypothetical protein